VRAIFRVSLIAALSISVTCASAKPAHYNWTGFYLGANAGWSFADASATGHKLDPNGFGSNRSSSASRSWNGFIGGGDVGFNWMALPNILVGIEADFSGTDLKDNFEGISRDGISYKTTRIDWIGTVRGRVGYAWRNWLIYGTGGAAWTHVHLTNTQGPCSPDPTCASSPVPLGTMDSNSLDLTGWAAGGGVEVGITQNWTAELHYLHMDFGTFTSANPSFNRFNTSSLTTDVVEAGVNYKFNAPR
jgi:opacity protein-like surface antigen